LSISRYWGEAIDEPADADKRIDDGAGSNQGPLRLRLFDWSGFIKDGALFVNLVGGSVAVGLGALGTLPPWMIQSNLLLFLSLAFAFTRVWKTVREERESGDLWAMIGEEVSSSGSGMGQMKDAVFEIPYLFSIVFMPLSAVSLQTFVLCLLVFYVTDNFYNLAILRGLSGEENDRPTPGLDAIPGLRRRARGAAGRTLRRATRGWFEPAIAILGDAMQTFLPIGRTHRNTIDREILTRFFGRRVVFNRIAILVLAIVAVLVLIGRRDVAEEAGVTAVLALLVMELALEPSRLLDAQYEPDEPEESDGDLLLWTTPAGTKLDAESRGALDRIHGNAFALRERQFTMSFMLAETGRHGYRLLLLTERAPGAKSQEVAGYLFLQARPELEVAYFWYLAVDERRRGKGNGRELVKLAVELVDDRWPSVQAVFLEADADVKDFYRHLGFWQASGVNYKIPANRAPDESLTYSPMFYPLRGSRDRVDIAFVKKAVRAMAADSFTNRRDERLKDLVKSLADLKPTAPPEGADLN
jgi:ribosomal protein S18 acetylase RimI-like enzyme